MPTSDPAMPHAGHSKPLTESDSKSKRGGAVDSAKRHHEISVVVLSKDEPDLAVTLELLQPQCVSLDAECVVVDASSRRLESIRQAHPWVTWIDYSGPFWRSSTIPHQRNSGCRVASGRIIAFCDAGGEPDADWLATITAPLVSGKFTLACGPVFSKRVGVYSVINDIADGEMVPTAPSGNLAFLRSVFDQVNGFDERLFYGSDLDFSWRCADSGNPCYQVRGARMVMDFGNSSLSLRRSWRYGRAFVRLLNLHPERRAQMIKNEPDRALYPLWILVGPLSFLAAASRKLRWAPFAWISILGLLLVRNRNAPGTYRVVIDHVVGGVSALNETARHISGEMAPVVFVPDDQTPYLVRLSESLETQGTPVSSSAAPSRSATINLILGPLWNFVRAWRGVKIIHIHWTYKFSPSSDPIIGRLARWWFQVYLASAHAAGVKIVWTAHNLLPHEPVFDDDVAARHALANRVDAVIALSAHSAREVSERFGVTNVTVIPLGPIELPSSGRGRDRMRKTWGIDQRTCFTFFGYLRPYKGLESLIAVAERLGTEVAVFIAGQGDGDYVAELATLVAAANAAGADIQFAPYWHSDDELADLLAASDVCVFPFVHIDNSGSVLLAQSSGLPVIIPDLASLSQFDNPGVFRFDHTDPVTALQDAMLNAAKMDHDELAALGQAGRESTIQLSWSEIADATAGVYARAVRQQ